MEGLITGFEVLLLNPTKGLTGGRKGLLLNLEEGLIIGGNEGLFLNPMVESLFSTGADEEPSSKDDDEGVNNGKGEKIGNGCNIGNRGPGLNSGEPAGKRINGIR